MPQCRAVHSTVVICLLDSCLLPHTVKPKVPMQYIHINRLYDSAFDTGTYVTHTSDIHTSHHFQLPAYHTLRLSHLPRFKTWVDFLGIVRGNGAQFPLVSTQIENTQVENLDSIRTSSPQRGEF